MVQQVDAAKVQELSRSGAQVVEVLPRAEYEAEHLPGAISLPLKEMDGSAVAVLNREKPVIVYCADQQCDQSPRAAKRLETLGFAQVYDYVDGKADWTARALPVERSGPPRVLDAVEPATTCRLEDDVASIKEKVESSGDVGCLVVDDDDIVLGRIRPRVFLERGATSIAAMMEEGPSTYRPNVPLKELLDRMRKNVINNVVVSDPDGRLIGILRRERAEQVMAGA